MSDVDENSNNNNRKGSRTSVLTEEEKKAHHIASEQKRRINIRGEFDRIVALTPELSVQENRSELQILTKSADYIDRLKKENEELVNSCKARGIEVPQELIYEGPKSDI